MKKNTKIRVICFLLIFALLVQGTTLFFKASDTNTLVSLRALDNEEPNDIDVLIMGQSEVYTGFVPTIAYDEYGYSSFAYGMSAMPASILPAVLEHASLKQHPKVLMVEITAFSKPDKYYERNAELHSFIDNLPIGKERLDVINKYIPEDRKAQFFRPVSTYHDNWKMPDVCASNALVRFMTATHKRNVLKGFSASARKMTKPINKKDTSFCFDTKSREYLERFIQTCKDNGYENVLFVRFPHGRKIKNKEAMKEIEKTIEDSGYDFLNLNDKSKKLGIDTMKDYYGADHMNLFGAEKNTRYLSEYLLKHYDLQPHTDPEFIERWNGYSEDAHVILDYGRNQLKNNTDSRTFEYGILLDNITNKVAKVFPMVAKQKKGGKKHHKRHKRPDNSSSK